LAEVPKAEASAFGEMAIDAERNITVFIEKPADPPTMPTMPGKADVTLASMGIDVFNADYLYQLLEEDLANPASSHDRQGHHSARRFRRPRAGASVACLGLRI
jgi:glucose-1-phosphate adenylyltransferase